MANFLSMSKPVPYILPLTSADHALAEGIEGIPIPPTDPETIFLLQHGGIREAVYKGSHILDRLCGMPLGGSEQWPPLMLFRHALDIADSIGTLMRLGSTSNAAILLRSLFESFISLAFLLENNALQEERSRCYWVSIQIRRLELFKKYDPSTDAGKAFHRLLDNDPVLSKASFPRRDHTEDRNAIEKYLSDPRYKSIWDRYKAAKQNKKPRQWYSLCSKADSIRSLAALVGGEAHYALVYDQLSELVHGTDVVSDILRHEEGRRMSMHQIRGPVTKIQLVAVCTTTYLLKCHLMVLQTYFRDDEATRRSYGEWYRTYQPYYRWTCDL